MAIFYVISYIYIYIYEHKRTKKIIKVDGDSFIYNMVHSTLSMKFTH